MIAHRPLRILICHNYYQHAGGEDAVFANEAQLLREAGSIVETLEVSNASIETWVDKGRTALGAIYSHDGRKRVATAIAAFRPDIVHVHNLFPLLSPAIFDACAEAGVPAVWTLHNFRIACAQGMLFRDGAFCDRCVGKVPLPAIKHRCYRGSTAGSAAVAGMIAAHRVRGTWNSKVARFIVLNSLGREVAIRSGVPAERISIKPNFAAAPTDRPAGKRDGALYLGRLSPEKGVGVLLEAWHNLPDVPLTIIGDGPDRAKLESAAPANVRFLGHRSPGEVTSALLQARALVLPSLCFENSSMALCEAMAAGTPVIASAIGAQCEVLTHGQYGLLFPPNDPVGLATMVKSAFAQPDHLEQMGHAARKTWQSRLSPDTNLAMLLEIYREALAA